MRATIVAEVDDELEVVRGTMTLSEGPWTLIDPLESLPEPDPDDDLRVPRTFPRGLSRGSVAFAVAGDTVTFETRLPRRYGDVGATAHGLFGNGAWYPQPLDEGELPIVDWEVTLALPEGAVGALGDVVGRDTLVWTGRAERASVAVLPRGRITHLRGDGFAVELLTRGAPRPALRGSLVKQLPLLDIEGEQWTGVVVEATLRRRLARPGVGLAYVSDHSWRVLWLLGRLHHLAPLRQIATALAPQPDPFHRELAGGAASMVHLARAKGMDARGAERLTRLLPSVDSALSDGLLPFSGDIYESLRPLDRIADDLGLGLVRGDSIADALARSPVDTDFMATWRPPDLPQDYRMELDNPGRQLHVLRDAPPEARAETLVVEIDGDRHPWTAGPGPDETTIPLEDRARLVKPDPDTHVAQTSRVRDLQPARYRVLLYGGVYLLTVNPFDVEGFVAASLRKRGDTFNVWTASLSTDAENLASVGFGYIRYAGPLLTERSRPHRFAATLYPSVLDPNFAPTQGGRFALGTAVSYTFDNRLGVVWPARGIRLRIAASAGLVPENLLTWLTITGSWTGLVPLHPRHVLAFRATGGMAVTDLNHRLLPLGGIGGLQSLPSDAALGSYTSVATMEHRWAPLRGVSIPHALGWVTEVQLTAGLEAGAALVDEELGWLVGATAGIAAGTDLFGMLPTLGGVTFAWPLMVEGIDAQPTPEPIIYLRAFQAF